MSAVKCYKQIQRQIPQYKSTKVTNINKSIESDVQNKNTCERVKLPNKIQVM